jgi:hypothetical protein
MYFRKQLGILKFQTLLLVVLLFICTCTYLHGVFPAFLDRNKNGYVFESIPRSRSLGLEEEGERREKEDGGKTREGLGVDYSERDTGIGFMDVVF